MGRGYEHFLADGTHLASEADVDDPYQEEAREALLRLDERRRPPNEQLEL